MRVGRLASLAPLALVAACHSSLTGARDMAADAGFSTTTFDLGCASASSQASLVPVNLVFLLDQSGFDGRRGQRRSGAQVEPRDRRARRLLRRSRSSAGLSASLALFPSATDVCNPSVYYAAAVPMEPLPDATRFAQAMAAAMPMGDTPTRPAILGAIDYAKDTSDATPGARTAIVLVTDGDPDVCDSSVANVSFEVAKVASTIPTYVIGVGQSLSSLDMIAASGGTGAPTLVDVGDSAATKSEFLTALENIRGLVLSCDFPLPSPPAGMTLDFTAVNVLYTPSAPPPTQLLYDSACSTGIGWRYDDPKQPTKVELCPSSCATVRQDHGGRIDVVFGCATDGNLIE